METEKDCKYIPFGSDPELDKKYLKAWNKISFLKKHNNYGLDKYYDHVMRQVYGVIFPSMPTYDFVFFIEQGCGIDEIIDITMQFYNHGWHDSDYNEIMLALVKYGRRISKQLATDSSFEIREEVAKKGYCLDYLMFDNYAYYTAAREIACSGIREAGGLTKWFNNNEDKRYYNSISQALKSNSRKSAYFFETCKLLIDDNLYLDFAKFCNSYDRKYIDSYIEQKIQNLGCNSLEEWMEKYPDRVFYDKKNLTDKQQQLLKQLKEHKKKQGFLDRLRDFLIND